MSALSQQSEEFRAGAALIFAKSGNLAIFAADRSIPNVMLVTKIRFSELKCRLSLFSPMTRPTCFAVFLGTSAMTNTGKFGGRWISALPLVVVFAIGSTAASAQTRIGTANSVKPEATGSIAGTLSAGSGVHQSENIHTGSSGQADLRFLDNSNLTVGPGSNVRLDKFVYDPDKGTRGVAIEASRGAFRFVTASQGKGSVSIKTPSGTLGIRG
jgi:hypothetical protein